MYREIMKRFSEIQDTLAARNQPPERELPRFVNCETFKEITGLGDTAARAYFKNRELIRRGILVKFTDCTKRGGWYLDYGKWLKWANNNAKMALNV
jgi:hypothetical protein